MKTKEQELQQLNDFVKTLDPGGYLEALFTPNFVRWVERHVNCDIMPDMLDTLENVSAQYSQTYSDLRVEQQRSASAKEAHKKELAREVAQRENLTAELEKRLKAESKRLHEAWDRSSELRAALNEKEARVEELEREMLKLKAHLYDLQNS